MEQITVVDYRDNKLSYAQLTSDIKDLCSELCSYLFPIMYLNIIINDDNVYVSEAPKNESELTKQEKNIYKLIRDLGYTDMYRYYFLGDILRHMYSNDIVESWKNQLNEDSLNLINDIYQDINNVVFVRIKHINSKPGSYLIPIDKRDPSPGKTVYDLYTEYMKYEFGYYSGITTYKKLECVKGMALDELTSKTIVY